MRGGGREEEGLEYIERGGLSLPCEMVISKSLMLC